MARLKQYNGTSWEYIDGSVIPTGGTVSEPTLILANTSPTADGSIGFDRTGEDLQIGDGTNSQVVHMGAWIAWTPTWTNLTVGSGINSGAYCQIGKTVHYRAYFKYGSGSAVGTNPALDMPVTPATYATTTYVGNSRLIDASTSAVVSGTVYQNGTILQYAVSGANITHYGLSATSPWTWATDDSITVSGTYEAA